MDGESSVAATQAIFDPRKKADTLPHRLAGLAHKTCFQDLPPSVVFQMALSVDTQSFVLHTGEWFCAHPFLRSTMCMESNSKGAL